MDNIETDKYLALNFNLNVHFPKKMYYKEVPSYVTKLLIDKLKEQDLVAESTSLDAKGNIVSMQLKFEG